MSLWTLVDSSSFSSVPWVPLTEPEAASTTARLPVEPVEPVVPVEMTVTLTRYLNPARALLRT